MTVRLIIICREQCVRHIIEFNLYALFKQSEMRIEWKIVIMQVDKFSYLNSDYILSACKM